MLLVLVFAVASSFVVPSPRAPPMIRKVHDVSLSLLDDPAMRFGLVAVTVAGAFTSKVSRSTLAKPRPEKPHWMNATAWRENELARWRVADARVCVYYLRLWARQIQRTSKTRFVVEDIDGGVRIKFGAQKVYLSATEERRLEKTFEDTPLPVACLQADSIYKYPKRRTIQAAGGLDLVSNVAHSTVSVSRCAYAKNEPIKYSTERTLLWKLEQGLISSYDAQPIPPSLSTANPQFE